MKGKLPSSRGIEAFLTLASVGSVRAAASALNLTPSAITHRIKTLELDVGLALFERRGREVTISPDGTLYRDKILSHVGAIREAAGSLLHNPGVDRISIASIDLFHSNWLMPRINRFTAEYPAIGIDFVNIASRQAVDADITVRPAFRPGGDDEVQLFGWEVTPFCQLDFARRHRLRSAQDLHHVPLIDMATPLKTWKRWFAVAGVPFIPGSRQIRVDRFENGLAAAAAGMGVFISTPRFVVDVYRDLIAPVDCTYPFPGGMFVSTARNGKSEIGRHFAQWLLNEANS